MCVCVCSSSSSLLCDFETCFEILRFAASSHSEVVEGDMSSSKKSGKRKRKEGKFGWNKVSF